MYRVVFRRGPFKVESFGVKFFIGFAAATMVARAELRRHGRDPRLAYDVMLYAYVGGLAGARLLLVFTAWDMFVRDPLTFLLSGSGWVWYGGLIGGTAAVCWGTWRRDIPLRVAADMAAPALALGQAIGRIGCQLAGDGDYGIPTTLPWAMSYPGGVVPTTDLVHPTPVYEAIVLAAIFLWLWRWRQRRAPGVSFGYYLTFSGLARFAVEFIRRNPPLAVGLTLAQWIGAASLLAGLVIVLRLAAPSGAPRA